MTTTHLLEAVGLRRRYRARGLGSAGPVVTALDGVDLVADRGETLGVVGGSGAGKSTLVRLLLGLEKPDEGVVRFDGHRISAVAERSIRGLRRRFQPVFQDSMAALDPRMRIEDAVAEPLAAFGIGDPEQRRRTVVDLLRQVDLPVDVMRRTPAALSGGERQRVAIARALAPSPELLILDEPVSSLDATVALQVIDLLRELQRSRDLTHGAGDPRCPGRARSLRPGHGHAGGEDRRGGRGRSGSSMPLNTSTRGSSLRRCQS